MKVLWKDLDPIIHTDERLHHLVELTFDDEEEKGGPNIEIKGDSIICFYSIL